MKRQLSLVLLLGWLSLAPIALMGCGSSTSGPIAPEKFVPPPAEGDKVSSDKG